jgi:hypothetical protein
MGLVRHLNIKKVIKAPKHNNVGNTFSKLAKWYTMLKILNFGNVAFQNHMPKDFKKSSITKNKFLMDQLHDFHVMHM